MSFVATHNAEASKVCFIELCISTNISYSIQQGLCLQMKAMQRIQYACPEYLVFSQQLKRCLNMSALSSERQGLPCEVQSSGNIFRMLIYLFCSNNSNSKSDFENHTLKILRAETLT